MRLQKNNDDFFANGGTLVCPEIGAIARYKPDYFTEIVMWDSIGSPERQQGKYALGSATAELVLESHQDRNGRFESWKYRLQMTFTKLGDGQQLYELIRAGKILPVLPYKGEQADTPVRQFRDLWREFCVLCRARLRQWEIA